MNKKVISMMLLLAATILSGCSSDGDDPPQPAQETGAPLQVMVVFAPGELGDGGYADDVLEGLNQLKRMDDEREEKDKDAVDVDFISRYDAEDTRNAVTQWAGQKANPFHDGDYSRRLLVISDPTMIPLLGVIKDDLRPTDEVLLLKVYEADVAKAAADYGLGERVHGLNISLTESIRRFCRYMDRAIAQAQTDGKEWNRDFLPIFRRYDESTWACRDSISEVLAEELGTSSRSPIGALNQMGAVFTLDAMTQMQETAYSLAQAFMQNYQQSCSAFCIVDFGKYNAGWDYYLLGHEGDDLFETLMIDARELATHNRYYVKRDFRSAFFGWGYDWMKQESGTLPRMTLIYGEQCVDNIPDMIDY
ncbi:MAG: hypothetical protein IJ546_00875 [Prevotella sp.]|nr:hypothetical protein [Prevotella sp.]